MHKFINQRILSNNMDLETINVDDGEMKKANYPDELVAHLGPCIAIGVYDPITKSGYLMHESHFPDVDLDGKIQKIKKDYEDLSRLKVFAAGNSFISGFESPEIEKKQKEFEQSSRPHVEKVLRYYFKEFQIKWVPDNYCASFYLHTETGKFELEVDCLDEIL